MTWRASSSRRRGASGSATSSSRRSRSLGWTSVRVRLSLLYSAVVFGLGAVVVALVYVGMSESLANQPVTETELQTVPGDPACYQMRGLLLCELTSSVQEVEVVSEVKVFERLVNQRALERFRLYSYVGLGGLFLLSMVIGWVLSGQVLRPVGRLTKVAREIGATDLSRRIRLGGPDDELKAMADTFDEMLDRIDEAFESQRRFIHEASHELRNPIAVIRTNVEVALADVDASAEELRDTLTVVDRAAARIAVLVEDLLVYARREAPAERETVVDVAAVVAESAGEFLAPAEARGLQPTAHSSAGLLVHGDPVALKQALANLLANAVRLAPPSTLIQVAAGLEGSWVWMAVQDQGPGIAPEDHAKVFERFYRGDPARARSEGHSGLGLTIVRQIAKGHGGSVGLRSALGAGATFSIWLPALSESPVGVTVPIEDAPAATGAGTPGAAIPGDGPSPVSAGVVVDAAPGGAGSNAG